MAKYIKLTQDVTAPATGRILSKGSVGKVYEESRSNYLAKFEGQFWFVSKRAVTITTVIEPKKSKKLYKKFYKRKPQH